MVTDFEIRRLLTADELRTEGIRSPAPKSNLLETLAKGYSLNSKIRIELARS